jgi:hypothetical protein
MNLISSIRFDRIRFNSIQFDSIRFQSPGFDWLNEQRRSWTKLQMVTRPELLLTNAICKSSKEESQFWVERKTIKGSGIEHGSLASLPTVLYNIEPIKIWTWNMNSNIQPFSNKQNSLSQNYEICSHRRSQNRQSLLQNIFPKKSSNLKISSNSKIWT